MTKQDVQKRILLSSALAVLSIAIVIVFCIAMLVRYSYPHKDNTTVVCDTVQEVYHGVPSDEVTIVLSSGESLKLTYPHRVSTLYSSIGYDITQLQELLTGKTVRCLKMEHLPWAVEIHVGDIVIDNHELTVEQIKVSRIGIYILGSIIISSIVVGDLAYLMATHKRYKKAEKKRARKRARMEKRSS